MHGVIQSAPWSTFLPSHKTRARGRLTVNDDRLPVGDWPCVWAVLDQSAAFVRPPGDDTIESKSPPVVVTEAPCLQETQHFRHMPSASLMSSVADAPAAPWWEE